MGRGAKVGGGIGGGLILLIAALLGVNPALLEGLTGGAGTPDQSQGTAPACKTGADADARLDCRITGTVNSLNAFWPAYLEDYEVQYPQPQDGDLQQAAPTPVAARDFSAVGPFYCPADTTAYFDPGFFQELVDRFGSSGGPLAQEYVVAHEFGHHVQNILGNLDRAQQDPQGPGVGRRPGRNCRPTATQGSGRSTPPRSRTRQPASRSWNRSPSRTSTTPSPPPPPSATTGSRRRPPAVSRPRPGPTAPARSGRSGSARATRPATSTSATRSARHPLAASVTWRRFLSKPDGRRRPVPSAAKVTWPTS